MSRRQSSDSQGTISLSWSFLFIYIYLHNYLPSSFCTSHFWHPSFCSSLSTSLYLSLYLTPSLPPSLSFCVCFSFLLQFHHTYPIHPNHSDLYLSCNINLTPHRFFLSLHLSFFCLISHLRLTFPPNIGHWQIGFAVRWCPHPIFILLSLSLIPFLVFFLLKKPVWSHPIILFFSFFFFLFACFFCHVRSFLSSSLVSLSGTATFFC